MSSVLNNSAALSALQALQMTQQSLNTVQNQVSTGLTVATAADNSSYWSIAAQLNADSGVVTASNDALSQGQSILATASSAINSVITTINSIQTALTQATNPGANIGNINTSLASLGAAADRRRQRRVVQRPERPERQPDHDQLRLRLQRQRDRRDGQHHRLHRFCAVRLGHRRNVDVDDQPVNRHGRGDDGSVADPVCRRHRGHDRRHRWNHHRHVRHSRDLRGHDQPGVDGPVDGSRRHGDDDDLHCPRRQRQLDRPGRLPHLRRRGVLRGDDDGHDAGFAKPPRARGD